MLLYQVARGLEGFRLGGYDAGHRSLKLDPKALFVILCVHVFAKVRGTRRRYISAPLCAGCALLRLVALVLFDLVDL
jgi:hypothetical protein